MNMTTVPSNQIKAMQHEVESLKEQVAQWETEYNGCSTLLNNAERTIETLEETIAQQAEAIRLKDAALDWCIGEFNLRLDDIDLSQETISVLSARHIQSSPEILQARDERVAEACATQATNWGNSRLDDNGGHALRNCAKAIRSGEWRKYL